MVLNLILGIVKLLCHGLVPDGAVQLHIQEKKWKLALRVLLKILYLKSRLNSQVLSFIALLLIKVYTEPLGLIHIYFTSQQFPLCNIRILLEQLLLTCAHYQEPQSSLVLWISLTSLKEATSQCLCSEQSSLKLQYIHKPPGGLLKCIF